MARTRLRGTIANLLVAALAVSVGLVVLELAFRAAPQLLLPPGSFGAGRRSPELGFNVHGSRVIYTKVGGSVTRDPNRDGFLDVEHERAKPRSATRIGFFGDSYVESAQVPLDTVFHRQLEPLLRDHAVETLGFGVSGWGTVHALRAFEAFGPAYGIDLAVYVFVENDPGDESFELAQAQGLGSNMPFAELSSDGASYRMRWTVEPGSEPWWFGAAKWLQRHSLLAHLVRARLAILRQTGVQVQASEGDRAMTTRAGPIPNPNDLPSSWPGPIRERTLRLTELALADWQRATAANGVRFAVLYVPRGEPQLRGELSRDDTWLPWLEATCARLGIPLLDPSDALRARLEAGEAVYGDHWTPAGHAAIAALLAERLPAFLPARPAAVPAAGVR